MCDAPVERGEQRILLPIAPSADPQAQHPGQVRPDQVVLAERDTGLLEVLEPPAASLADQPPLRSRDGVEGDLVEVVADLVGRGEQRVRQVRLLGEAAREYHGGSGPGC